ncbi:hypothetical protein ACFCV3_25055 [Kribbella sp. NPDC056345]|uniref:hypothetical protein n=1 Tax=Kribbella sp. NPDC056345 TaxID=3345789 RepID=UPI0035DA1910
MSYQPPGGIAAPDYGQRPPRKSRAGLFIVLMLVLLVALLVSFAVIATQVFTGLRSADPSPVPSFAPASSPTPKKPTKPGTTKPASTADQVAEQFVVRLNLNDLKGAAALGCADTTQPMSVLIGQFVRSPTLLTVSKTSVSSAGPIAVYALSGRTKGAEVGGSLVLQVAGGPPCVKVFGLHPSR